MLKVDLETILKRILKAGGGGAWEGSYYAKPISVRQSHASMRTLLGLTQNYLTLDSFHINGRTMAHLF